MKQTEILLESKTAREGQLTKVTHESAIDTLSKAKALVFALWQGTGAATTQEVRSEVSDLAKYLSKK